MTRFLRTTALLLSILLLTFTLSSCDWIDALELHLSPATEARGIPEDNDSEYVELSSDGYVCSPYYSPVDPRHSYQLLTSGQQALYDQLIDSVREVYPDTEYGDLYKTRQVIVDDYLLSSADIRIAAKALYDDFPDIFWLSGTIYQLTDESDGYTAVQMRSVYSPDDITRMQEELTLAVNHFYSEVPSDLSPYAREKYVHDYIAEVCEYDKVAAENDTASERNTESYIVYGTLVSGKAVCEGYARAMQLLLCGLGVDCVGITGLGFDNDGESELHMWNAVQLDGDWYLVDPTWDDQSEEYNRYRYFNLDADSMDEDHRNSRLLSDLSDDEVTGDETFSAVAMNIFVPECDSVYYQYYRYECPHLEDYDGREVIDGLYDAAQNRAETFTFYIDPEALDYDEALDLLFKSYPQYFFNYVSAANEWLYDIEIDNSNLSYYTNKERNAVTVLLSYY